MANLRTFIILSVIILLATASCGPTSTSTIPTPTPTIEPTTAPTQTAAVAPTIPASPVPSDTPAATPANSNLHLPNGFAAYSASTGVVTYYDLQGQALGELQTPNLGTGTYRQTAIAGSLSLAPNQSLPPLVFYVFQNDGELWVNNDNQVSLVRTAPNMFSMVGASGKSNIAFTTLEYLDIGLKSLLYVTDLQSLATAEPIIDTTNTESFAIKPLAIAITDTVPAGVWYTTVPYGIGGNIVFEPRKTLNYLNLSTYKISTYLDSTKAPSGISDDQTWVAYTSASSVGPLTLMHNFDNASAITIPLLPDSDRGSGDAVFSPDNQYVAWREASDVNMGANALVGQTIRIANTRGEILAEIPDPSLLSITNLEQIGWLVPVGWLDTQTLAFEVRSPTGDNAYLLSVKYDGSGLAMLATGTFVGLLYP